MRRREFLLSTGVLTLGGCVGGRTPTPSPTPPDYVDRFETGLVIDDVEPLELAVENRTVTLVYAVIDPTEARVSETIRDVATAYAQTIGTGWPVDYLRATVRTRDEAIVRYRIETAWVEAFNDGGTAGAYGEKIAGTVERVDETATDR